MKALEQKILKEGTVLPGNVLKVGSFLNQKIDSDFIAEVGREIARLYEGCGVTKILTVESSGIAIAVAAGIALQPPLLSTIRRDCAHIRRRSSRRSRAQSPLLSARTVFLLRRLRQDFPPSCAEILSLCLFLGGCGRALPLWTLPELFP